MLKIMKCKISQQIVEEVRPKEVTDSINSNMTADNEVWSVCVCQHLSNYVKKNRFRCFCDINSLLLSLMPQANKHNSQ